MPYRMLVLRFIHLYTHTFMLLSRLCNTWISMHFCFYITMVVAILTYGSFSLDVCPSHLLGLRDVSNITTVM